MRKIRSEILKIKASVTKLIKAISEVEVEILLFTSWFVEAPGGVFDILSPIFKNVSTKSEDR